MWQEGGVAVGSVAGSGVPFGLTEDGSGGTYVAWADTGPAASAVHAQHLDSSGNLLWGETGVLLQSDSVNLKDLEVIGDGHAGLICCWEAYGPDQGVVWGQRLDASGHSLWSAGSVPVCTGFVHLLSRADDSSFIMLYGVAFVGFYAQKYGLAANPLWNGRGAFIGPDDGGDYFSTPFAIVSDCHSGAYIGWEWMVVFLYQNQPYYYLQERLTHVQSAGIVDSFLCLTNYEGNGPFWPPGPMVAVASDSSGGALLAWFQRVGEARLHFSRAVDTSLVWPDRLVSESLNVRCPAVVTDRAGGDIICFQDTSNAIWLARCGPTGLQWLIEMDTSATTGIAGDDSSGAVVASKALEATWVRADGRNEWSRQLCPAGDSVGGFELVNDGKGGTVVVWIEQRSGQWSIYAQRLNTYTTPGIAEGSVRSSLLSCGKLSAEPNPFGHRVSILISPSMFLGEHTLLQIFCASGRIVRSMPVSCKPTAPCRLTWDGADDLGRVVPAGVYFARLTTSGGQSPLKIIKAY
jgi:hypothetical protein